MIKGFERKRGIGKLFVKVARQIENILSNQPIKTQEIANSRLFQYDLNIGLYDKLNQALLDKRWTKKDEIPHKMYIVQHKNINKNIAIQNQLHYQKLIEFKALNDLSKQQMQEIDGEYNSIYIISQFVEPHFKGIVDEYVNKINVNGFTVPYYQLEEQQQVKDQIMGLYWKFFYGDEISELEYYVILRYLNFKYRKHKLYKIKVSNNQRKKAEQKVYSCVWTVQNQKMINFYLNYQQRDIMSYDNYRPFFRNVDYSIFDSFIRFQRQFITEQTKTESSIQQVIYSKQELHSNLVDNIKSQTKQYLDSIEFTSSLQLLPDYQIEMSILHLHYYLLRLRIQNEKDIGNIEKHFKIKNIKQLYSLGNQILIDFYYETKIQGVEVHNQQICKTFNQQVQFFNYYFVDDIENLEYNIVNVVYSTILLGKNKVKDESVYLLSEYFLTCYQYLMQEDIGQILNGDIKWDVFRMRINPQNIFNKMGLKYLQDLDKIDKKKFIFVKQPSVYFQMIKKAILRTYWKYQSIETYDIFNQIEEKSKKSQQKQKKYVWKLK